MAFCPKCGSEIQDDDKFCPSCGSSIAQRKAASAGVASEVSQPEPISSPKPPPIYAPPQSAPPPIPAYVGEPVSGALWLLPIFFWVIGGIIAWAIAKDRNPVMARNMLIVGLLLPVIFYGSICIIAAISSSASNSYSYVVPETRMIFASFGVFV